MQRAIRSLTTLSVSNKTFDKKYWRDSVVNAAKMISLQAGKEKDLEYFNLQTKV